jgi:hypothetical protein
MRHINKDKEKQSWERRTTHNLSRKGKNYSYNRQGIRVSRVLNYEKIEAPVFLDLYTEENRDLTLEFINLIEKKALERKVLLDFSHSDNISAPALLLLYATIDTLKNTDSVRLIKFQNLKGRVRTTVEKSGLLDLVKNMPPRKIDAQNTVLPIIKGSAKGEEFEVVIDHVQHRIFDNGLTPKEENIWGTAVIETVSNVKLHAYTSEDNKPWWIICSVIDDDLYLAICDKGVGIPNTIKNQNWIQDIIEKTPSFLKKLMSNKDADAIDLSMMVGETSTQKEKHGLGSKSIRALVDENPNGALWVFSNRGVYYKKDEDVELKNFTRSISGTLVQWNIKLKK